MTKAAARLVVLALVAVASTARLAAAPGSNDWAVAILPSGAEFSLEIADDPAKRQRGYMFRDEVGPHEGMIFVFDRPGRHTIWMKNCRVPLDIVWLDASFRVVYVAYEQPPCPADGPCIPIAPPEPAAYVLELAGGVARGEGLVPGDAIVVLWDRAGS